MTRYQINELIQYGFQYNKRWPYLRARANIANLLRVRKVLGRVSYAKDLMPTIERLRKVHSNMKEAQKIKIMTKSELLALAKSLHVEFPSGKGIQQFEHQLRGVLYLWMVPRAGLYYDAGLGKTYIGTVLFDNLKRQGLAKRMLVITNTDLVDRAWIRDIHTFSNLSVIDAHQEVGVEKKTAAMHTDHDICIQSYNGYRMLGKREHQKNEFEICFFDESSIMKNPDNKIVEAVRNTVSERLILASGLPAPNSEKEFYPQMQVIGDVLGCTHGAFKSHYMYQPRPDLNWLWAFKPGKRDELLREIEPYTIFAKKQDWIDCPDRIGIDLVYSLSKEQRKHYEELEEDYFTYLFSGEKVRAANELTLRGKLAQVTNGFLISKVGEPALPIAKDIFKLPKFVLMKKKVDEILSNPDNNIVIWGRFRNDIEKIQEMLKEYNPAVAYGGVTKTVKNRNLDRWENDSTCRVLISNPKSTKFGHTWLKAGYMIWFSATESAEDYYQANQRNDRIGQKKTQIVDIRMIAKGTIESLIYGAIDTKTGIANYIRKRKGVRRAN